MIFNLEQKIKINETINGHPAWKNAEGANHIYLSEYLNGDKVWTQGFVDPSTGFGLDGIFRLVFMFIAGENYQKCPYSSTNQAMIWQDQFSKDFETEYNLTKGFKQS